MLPPPVRVVTIDLDTCTADEAIAVWTTWRDQFQRKVGKWDKEATERAIQESPGLVQALLARLTRAGVSAEEVQVLRMMVRVGAVGCWWWAACDRQTGEVAHILRANELWRHSHALALHHPLSPPYLPRLSATTNGLGVHLYTSQHSQINTHRRVDCVGGPGPWMLSCCTWRTST